MINDLPSQMVVFKPFYNKPEYIFYLKLAHNKILYRFLFEYYTKTEALEKDIFIRF